MDVLSSNCSVNRMSVVLLWKTAQGQPPRWGLALRMESSELLHPSEESGKQFCTQNLWMLEASAGQQQD